MIRGTAGFLNRLPKKKKKIIWTRCFLKGINVRNFLQEKEPQKQNGMNKWLIKQALVWVFFVTGKIIIKTKWYEKRTFFLKNKKKALMWEIIVTGKITTKNKRVLTDR